MSQTKKHCEPLVAVWLRPSTTEPCICCKQVAEKPRGEHLKNDVCMYVYVYNLNLQTVLFRPLRSHQCSSEWFENWDMSISQRAINTSHTDKQWYILFLNTRVLKLKRASNA